MVAASWQPPSACFSQSTVPMVSGGEGVAEEMRKLDDLTRIITESMNEMASGAVQINNAVQEVNEITQKNKQSIQNLAEEVGKFIEINVQCIRSAKGG